LRPTHRNLVLAAALAVLAPAGCGSGDGDQSRSDFVKDGNAICREAKADIRRAVRRGSVDQRGLPAREFLERVALQTLIPRLERQVQELRRLPVPPGDEGALRELFGSLQSALEQSKRRPFTFGPAGNSPYAKPDRLARAYGLTDCVSG
jgi:hypothetical protein